MDAEEKKLHCFHAPRGWSCRVHSRLSLWLPATKCDRLHLPCVPRIGVYHHPWPQHLSIVSCSAGRDKMQPLPRVSCVKPSNLPKGERFRSWYRLADHCGIRKKTRQFDSLNDKLCTRVLALSLDGGTRDKTAVPRRTRDR